METWKDRFNVKMRRYKERQMMYKNYREKKKKKD
jgi:hypothetical protein